MLLSPISLWILFSAIIVLGQFEFYKVFSGSGIVPNTIIGVLGGLFLFVLAVTGIAGYLNISYLTLAFPVAWLTLLFELYRKKDKPFQNIAITILGVIYIAVPFTLLMLTGFPVISIKAYQPTIILGLFLLQWTSDTGAYLVGITLGKHPLFPRISPKKSWEGFVGGIILTLIISFVLSKYFTVLSLPNWLVIGSIIAVFGVAGDLIESLLKRSFNIKDSGNILPGHGGILDRFDSVIFSAPFVFIYLYLQH